MKYVFMLSGETPAKKNNRITLANRRSIPSQRYRDWNEVAITLLALQARKQGLKAPIAEPVKISITLTHGTNRRRDADNALSSILDTLTDARVLADDNFRIAAELHIYNRYDKNNAGVKIEIENITEEE